MKEWCPCYINPPVKSAVFSICWIFFAFLWVCFYLEGLLRIFAKWMVFHHWWCHYRQTERHYNVWINFQSIEGRKFYCKGSIIFPFTSLCIWNFIQSRMPRLLAINTIVRQEYQIYIGFFFMEWFLMYIKSGALIFLSYMYSIQPTFLPKQLSPLWCFVVLIRRVFPSLCFLPHTYRWCQTKVRIEKSY